MRIGIITWFTGSNYGTNLQAIALQYFLRERGDTVEIINYEVIADSIQTKSLWRRILEQPQKYINKYSYWKYSIDISERNRKIESEVREKCNLTKPLHLDEEFVKKSNEYDLLICGGDQIWNPNWYHRFYFADYDQINTRRISYAPSIGVSDIPYRQKENIRRSLSKFADISVREKRSAEIISELIGKNVTTVVDPVFLLDKKEWNKLFPIRKIEPEKYVLSMFLTDNKEHWKAANRFAREKGYRHIIIPYCGWSYLQNAEIHMKAGLGEVLDLIRGAEYVLTDSFHITAFSIINGRQFYTFQRFKECKFVSTNERIRNLLETVHCMDRFILYDTNIINEGSRIDYENVLFNLNKAVMKSKVFLLKAIRE